MGATDDSESNGASLFGFGDLLGCARCGFTLSSCTAELLCVGEYKVHVLESILLVAYLEENMGH